MRIVGVLVLLVLLPLLWGAVSSKMLRRDHAMFLLGFSFFLGGFIKTDVALYTWPLWPSPDPGVVVGLPDALALVLLLTRNRNFESLPFRYLFLAHGTAIAISITLSSFPVASFFSLWQFCRVALVYFAIAGEAHDARMLGFLLKGLSCGLVLEAGGVINQKAHGVVQASGTAAHQNTMAVIVELIVMPILAVLMERRRQPVLWAGFVSALVILAGGGSRAGLGLAAFGIAITFTLSAAHSMTPRKSGIFAAALLVVGLMVPVAMSTLSNRFGSRSMVTDEGARDTLEAAAKAMSGDHPLGVGANMFVSTANLQGYARRAGVEWGGGTSAAPVHNSYLLERAELGWLGFLTYALLLFVPMIVAVRVGFSRPRTPASGVVMGSAAALAVLLLHSFYEYVPVTFQCFSLIALNLGIIGGVLRHQIFSKHHAKRRLAERPYRASELSDEKAKANLAKDTQSQAFLSKP